MILTPKKTKYIVGVFNVIDSYKITRPHPLMMIKWGCEKG